MDLKKIAIEKDNTDNLKTFKSKFINNPNEIYLDGNSLGKLPIESVKNLNEVINTIWRDISDKNYKITIVFAPACASFDQFENFEKRGAYFNQLIQNKLKK